MNTSQLATVILCAPAIAFVYLLFYFIVFRFASSELSQIGASREKDAIRIYADAESLEYYLRVAIAASGRERLAIIVHIRKDDPGQNEMKAIVRMMRRRHKNIFYIMS